MNAATPLVLVLLLAAAAADEDDNRLRGEFRTDPEALLRTARRDLDRCDRALARLREHPSDGEAERSLAIAADDARLEMEAFLRREGHPNAEVRPTLSPRGAAFEILEGPRAFLGVIEIEGAREVDRGELEGLVRLPRTWLLGSRLFVRSELERAAGKMVSYLRQRGFLEARVTGPVFDPPPDRIEGPETEIDASFTVREGPRAVLRSVTVRGMGAFRPPEVRDEFGESPFDLVGKPYGPLTPYDLQGILTGFLATRGHPYAEVTWEEPAITETSDGLAVAIVLTVAEGPRVRLRAARVEGLERTDARTILRELEFGPGEIYDSRKVAASRRILLDRRLFSVVRIELPARKDVPPADLVEVDPVVHVEEMDSRRLEGSLGFGSWDLLRAGGSMTWLNLGGAARTGEVELSASMRGGRLRAGVSEPWLLPDLLWDRTRGRVGIGAEVQERPTYSFRRLSADLSVRKAGVFENVDLRFGYTFRYTDVTEAIGDVPGDIENAANTGTLFLSFTREARDDPWTPTRGSFLTAGVEVASGAFASQLDFLRIRVRAVRIFPIDGRLALVALAEAGAISPFGSTDELPIQERFFLGGGESVRSFTQDDLGPRLVEDGGDTGSAAGGEFFSRVSLELRIPAWENLEGALFVDGGNVIRDLGDAGVKGYRFAVGAGIRYRTPLGAARFDVGVNPFPRDHEDRFAFFFALGYPF